MIIGGGIGVPPWSKWAKQHEQGVDVEVVVATKEAVILKKSFQLAHVTVTTDDGTLMVLRAMSLRILIRWTVFDAIYSCGAPGMLKHVNTKPDHPRAYISMESRMACGMGAATPVVHLENESQAAITSA